MDTTGHNSDDETIKLLQDRVLELESNELQLRKRLDAVMHDGDLLYALMDNIPDIIYFKDKHSRFVMVNNAWAVRRNLKNPQDAIGKSDFDFFTEDFAQHTFNAEKEIMQTGQPQEAQLEQWNVDEENRWFTSSKVPVRSKNGQIIGTCGITRDITELKRIEEELENANIDLERKIHLRTIELKKANTQLEQQLRHLDFLYKTSFTLSQNMCQVDVFSAILDSYRSCIPDMAGCICEFTEDNLLLIRSASMHFEHSDLHKYCEKTILNFNVSNLTEPILITDWRKHPSMNMFQWPVQFNQSCCLLVPLCAEDKVVSCIIIFTTNNFAEQYEQERSVVMTLSTIAAVCQKNALYYDELQKTARIEGELTAARNIQKRLIPHSRLSLQNIEIYGYYMPAYEVGGDYLDYFTNEDGHVIIAIGDVCGKGAPASMHMTMLRTTLRIKARNESSAANLVCEVNNAIRTDLSALSFISLLCIIIKDDRSSLTYARAGHPLLIRYSAANLTPASVECGGIALGLLSDSSPLEPFIEEVKIPLKTGDHFFIYTDGLVEAINETNEAYGIQRIIKTLQSTGNSDPERVVNSIIDDVDAFRNSVPHRDDLTLCAFSIV
jgi:PAS domain S-box-containing protein